MNWKNRIKSDPELFDWLMKSFPYEKLTEFRLIQKWPNLFLEIIFFIIAHHFKRMINAFFSLCDICLLKMDFIQNKHTSVISNPYLSSSSSYVTWKDNFEDLNKLWWFNIGILMMSMISKRRNISASFLTDWNRQQTNDSSTLMLRNSKTKNYLS